jgi:hypothetical protein
MWTATADSSQQVVDGTPKTDCESGFTQILASSSASTPLRTPTPRRRSGATGAVLEHLTVSGDPAGYRQLIGFGRRHDATFWAIEGTGSFGAGLTTALPARCERVVEVDRPQRPARRGVVKSDDIGAVRAALQALAGVGLSEPRRRGDRAAIRVLLTTRAQAITFRTPGHLGSARAGHQRP